VFDSFTQIRFMSNGSQQPAAGSGAGKVNHLSLYYCIFSSIFDQIMDLVTFTCIVSNLSGTCSPGWSRTYSRRAV